MNRRQSDMAMEQGCKAAEAGQPADANPYIKGEGLLWFHWNMGYESYRMEHDLIVPSAEAAHVAQWIELSTRAANFGLKASVTFEGFTLHYRSRSPAMAEWACGGQIGGPYQSLFDLRAAISNWVAAQRAEGRRF